MATATPAKRRTGTPFQRVAWLVVVLVLLAVALNVGLLWKSQRDERLRLFEATEQRSTQLASAVAERVNALVRSTDFVLQQLRREHGGDMTRLHARADALVRAYPDRSFLNFAITDAGGDLIYSSSGVTASINLRDRDYFIAHGGGGDRLLISKPLMGRVSKTWAIPFSRPLLRDGRFAGVAVITLSPEGVSQILARLELGPQDTIVVVDRAGTFLAHNREIARLVGKTVSPARPFMALDAAEHGNYRTAAFSDGADRVFAWHRVPDSDLFAVVGLDVNTVLAPQAVRFRGEWINAATLSALLVALGVGVLTLLNRMSRGQRDIAMSETKLRQLIDGVGYDMFVGLLTPDGTLVEMNRPALEVANLKLADVFGKPIEQTRWWAHSPATQQQIRAAVEQAAAGTPVRCDVQVQMADGKLVWIDFSLQPLRDPEGRIIYLVPSGMSIEGRKQAEAALLDRDLRLTGLIESAMDAVVSINDAHEIVLFNAAAENMFGHSSAAVMGKKIEVLIPRQHRPGHDAHIEAFRHTGTTSRRMGQLGQVAGLRADGTEFPAEASISQLRHGDQTTFTVILRDVSERVRAEAARAKLEAQLRQAQKMEALGTLAGGIAHDFNNILTAIGGNVELARLDAGADSPIQDNLAEIAKASQRASDLVRQILTFSRSQPQERRVVSLRDVAQEAAKLLRASLPAGIELVTTLAPDAPDVVADRTQLHQVLMNLGGNAGHAIGRQPGRIDITLAGVDVPGDVMVSALAPGRYARLSVIDSGSGMDAATLQRIFDPFFTTKAVGEGTGLGLAVVDGIVKRAGGAITVYSEPGRGCAFRLYFPAAALEASVSIEPPPTAWRNGAGQRILYLDDEASLVLIGKAMLERLGYKVYGYSSAEQALAEFEAAPEGFDAVITDFNMPGISGLDVAERVLRLRPDLPVALASGLVTDELVTQAQVLGIREVIYKPHALAHLATAMNRMLT